MGQDLKKLRVKMRKFLNDFVLLTETQFFEINPTKTVKSIMQAYWRKRIEMPILPVNVHVGLVGLIDYFENRKKHKLLAIIFDSPNLTWKAHID